jgi:PAS domain S-box-containing protein
MPLSAASANASAALANAELYSRVSVEKERSGAILANVADGIVALDRERKVVLWNAAAEAITGVPQEEAIGRSTMQVLQRELESEDGPARSGPRLVSIPRGSEEVWLSLSEAVMRDPLGAVAGRIFIINLTKYIINSSNLIFTFINLIHYFNLHSHYLLN